jgi:hypothetical protein
MRSLASPTRAGGYGVNRPGAKSALFSSQSNRILLFFLCRIGLF